ncbi:MAG: sugar transferase, partial [Bacteroidota bacterium]
RPEILGRLYSCGFEVIDEQFINNNLFFAVKKIRNPFYDYNPTYGPLVKMKRIGKGGKIIGVYKFRTMHPYSEYLHDYMLKHHGYSKKGKPANDFRITTWGKILRRFWLDELPQLINVVKGEMKLVGVRPISPRVYNDYPEEVKKLRSKYKPGCVPPYVALLMQNMADSIKAEEIYLKDKEKHPYTTDIKYLFKAIYNILTNKIRSA